MSDQTPTAENESPEVESGPARYVQPPTSIAEALKRLNTTPERAWKLAVAVKWGFSGDADSPYEYDQGDRLTIEYDDLYDLASIALAALKLLGANADLERQRQALRDRLRAVLIADMAERVAWHGPYGATSQEQWTFDTEKQMAHDIANDEELLDKLVAAAESKTPGPEGAPNDQPEGGEATAHTGSTDGVR